MTSMPVLVLVVEDEALISMVMVEALEEAGYAVATAATGEAAITLLEEKASDIRALLTDVRLAHSKMSGWDVARRARELKPELPVVYVSGDSAHEWSAKGVPHSLVVQKPFVPAQIVTAVSQLLNTASTAISPTSSTQA